jgi:SAM-dependent methyltransferase
MCWPARLCKSSGPGMRRCLKCSTEFPGPDWICPCCQFQPTMVGGFLSFAPELAGTSDGYDADFHHLLDQAQERSFWFRCRNRLIADIARQWFPSAATILEIGCGTGYVLAGLREALPYARYTGSESSATGLAYAACRLGSDVSLLQMNAEAIPFANEYDAIAACDVLEHLRDDVKALGEINWALKPGGYALLTVPQHPMLWSDADVLARHQRRYRRGELAAKCSTVGLQVVMDTSFVFSLLPVMMAQRLVRGRGKAYDLNSELSLPRWLDRILFTFLDAERRCIGTGMRFPVGGSRVVLARKRREPQ